MLRRVVLLVLTWLLVAAPSALVVALNSSEQTVIAGHEVTVRPTIDGYATFDLGPYLPDELTAHGRELYVSVPNGQGRSKLMEALVRRRLPTTITVRNWRTVEALAELTK